jgi:hypothetical protein
MLEDIFSDCINNDEINSYIQLEVEKKTTNLLEWWRSKEHLPIQLNPLNRCTCFGLKASFYQVVFDKMKLIYF